MLAPVTSSPPDSTCKSPEILQSALAVYVSPFWTIKLSVAVVKLEGFNPVPLVPVYQLPTAFGLVFVFE